MIIEKEMTHSTKVTLEAMLDAREKRVSVRQRLTAAWGCAVVCFSLNIPGEYKSFPLADKCFSVGSRLIFQTLEARCRVVHQSEIIHYTGNVKFFGVNADPDELKRLLMPIEENHPLGRLFDIDVYDKNGCAHHRQDMGRNVRACLLCGGPVWSCARSRRHSAEELSLRAVGIMRGYIAGSTAEELAQKAVRALMTEVCIAPKPGLVDRHDNGAHGDMNIFHFIDSGCELFSYFKDLALFGINYEDHPANMLQSIRYRGIDAERRMFLATDGVNTHKGAIFSLGIMCAAAGCMCGNGPYDEKRLFQLCAEIAQGTVDELKAEENICATHGESVYACYGLTGARGEAASGFASVQQYGLPVLREMKSRRFSAEAAGVAALLHLIAYVDDTNMVSRADYDTIKQIQLEMRSKLTGGMNAEELMCYSQELNSRFIVLNVSPGGCADLLALCFFAESLFP